MCDEIKLSKEIMQLIAQSESLEKWLDTNKQHPDREKVMRQMHAVNVHIKAKQQRIERHNYPARFQTSQEYSLPNFR